MAVLTGYPENQARAIAGTLSGGGPVHVSTGVAVGPGHAPGSFARLLTEADRDLYRQKNLRKNSTPSGGDPQAATC